MTVLDQPAPPATDPGQAGPSAAEQLMERLFGAALGTLELITIHLGDTLGLYRSLDRAGAQTATELARSAGCDERYVREWLEQQATAALLTTDATVAAESRRYALAPGVAEILLAETSPMYLAPVAALSVSLARACGSVAAAFRTGEGVPWAEYGPEAIAAQGAFNRPAYQHSLAAEWLPAVPDLHQRLQDRTRPARVLDVACGVGWSSIELAKAYPWITVDAVDNDSLSIATARRHAAEEGVDQRVRFELADAATLPAGSYDLVTVFEALHDLPHPVATLRAMAAAAGPTGSVLVMDERVQDSFTAPGDEMERLFYACSVLLCLPSGRTSPDSAATGTVMRTGTLQAYATEAGLGEVEVLPIEHPMFRFYRFTAPAARG